MIVQWSHQTGVFDEFHTLVSQHHSVWKTLIFGTKRSPTIKSILKSLINFPLLKDQFYVPFNSPIYLSQSKPLPFVSPPFP